MLGGVSSFFWQQPEELGFVIKGRVLSYVGVSFGCLPLVKVGKVGYVVVVLETLIGVVNNVYKLKNSGKKVI